MCVLFIAYRMVPDCPLLILANRDEFHHRPTKPLGYWKDAPNILAGRDMQGGGTWLGVNRQGQFAALTNYRQGHQQRQCAPTRGALVSDFLHSTSSPLDYIARLKAKASHYNGFNLVLGSIHQLYVYNNVLDSTIRLQPGFHGLSNAAINDPWPKINRGVEQLRDYLRHAIVPRSDELLMLMQNRQQAADHLLPDTGIGQEWERFLSPIFVSGVQYGTRCSSLLRFTADSQLHFTEYSYEPDGQVLAEHDYQLALGP